MTLEENVALKKELASRAWKRSPVGRTGFAVMVVLFVLAALSFPLMQALMAPAFDARGYDSLGLLGVELFVMAALIVTGYGVRVETWKRCNMDIGMRLGQRIVIENNYLTYTYRLKGDRYHGLGGTIMAVVNLSEGASIMGMDPQAGVIAFRGQVWSSYMTALGGNTIQSLDQMQPIEELHIPNCFIPDLYQTLLPYYR